MNRNGLGDKPVKKAPIEDGLSERSDINHHAKLRGETSEKTQRPVGRNETITDSRGSFPVK